MIELGTLTAERCGEAYFLTTKDYTLRVRMTDRKDQMPWIVELTWGHDDWRVVEECETEREGLGIMVWKALSVNT